MAETALAGAGVSAESGIPTFRGAGGLWRTYNATALGTAFTRRCLLLVDDLKPCLDIALVSELFDLQTATPEAFVRDPSLVWEFYHWRREVWLPASAARKISVCLQEHLAS